MFTEFTDLKKYNEMKIVNVLQNSTLTLFEKQLGLENVLLFNLNKLYDDNFIYKKQFLIFRNKLVNIDWLNIPGKTYLKDFFNVISKESFIDLILMHILMTLRHYNCYSSNIFKNYLLGKFKVYAYFNKIDILYIEKQSLKKFIISEVLEKSLAYIVEYLKEIKIIQFDEILNIFKVEDFPEICEQEATILVIQRWPLLIPANPYIRINNNYEGGYYLKDLTLNLFIDNEYVKGDLQINEKCLNNINKLQNIKYTLVQNTKIIEFIIKLEQFLSPLFLSKKENKKYLEDWYACYQYLILIKSGITNIYFPYILDFRGRMYNGITFGLNPTSNKLSRSLVGLGKYSLTNETKEYLKLYICACFKVGIDKFETLLNININSKNFQELIDKYSLKNLVILLDWKENVLNTNESEILIEMDASQSGFQILSLLSNDLIGMQHTNLISTENIYNLYNIILEKVIEKLVKKEWSKILNRDFIKRVVMTIPYGSTRQGQLDMLVEEFERQYSLFHLLKYNSMPIIFESNIIENTELLENLHKLNNKVINAQKKIDDIDLKEVNELQMKIVYELRKITFRYILEIINNVTNELYPNIIKFTKLLKNIKLTYIKTSYLTFSLMYYLVFEEKMVIGKKTYYKTIIDKYMVNERKSKTASIANICQGFGDAFIMHNIIENTNCSFYAIHDAILCKGDDIDILKNQILLSYRFVYNYYLQYSDFESIRLDKTQYELNSLNIFKIK
jgi:hypothetical protein